METNAQNAGKGLTRGADRVRRVTYASRPDATPEGELTALAAVYAFVIQAYESKQTAASRGEDREEVDTKRRRSGQGQQTHK